jgi:hypothetical protein
MKKINLMNSSSKEPRHLGFDVAVRRREDDFLNRWPLAKEIYGIAITGPQDWSGRVGFMVNGELAKLLSLNSSARWLSRTGRLL